MNNILMVLGGIAAGCILLWFLWRQYIFRQAAKIAQKVFPVWAGQGPFESGAESACAMKAAYAAVLGPEKAAEVRESIEKHQVAYDQDPNTWENFRKESLQASREINDYITVAEGLSAMESINKDILEGGGHRLEAVTNKNGGMDFVYKQIWSDDEVKNHNEETNKTIINAFGDGLLNTDTEAAKELLYFIVSIYRSAHDKDPETAYDIGGILFNCISYSDENPNDEISVEFRRLYEAYLPEEDEEEKNA